MSALTYLAATIATAPEASDDTTLAMAVAHSFTTGHAWEILLVIATAALFFATLSLTRTTHHLDKNTVALIENTKAELAAKTPPAPVKWATPTPTKAFPYPSLDAAIGAHYSGTKHPVPFIPSN